MGWWGGKRERGKEGKREVGSEDRSRILGRFFGWASSFSHLFSFLFSFFPLSFVPLSFLSFLSITCIVLCPSPPLPDLSLPRTSMGPKLTLEHAGVVSYSRPIDRPITQPVRCHNVKRTQLGNVPSPSH